MNNCCKRRCGRRTNETLSKKWAMSVSAPLTLREMGWQNFLPDVEEYLCSRRWLSFWGFFFIWTLLPKTKIKFCLPQSHANSRKSGGLLIYSILANKQSLPKLFECCHAHSDKWEVAKVVQHDSIFLLMRQRCNWETLKTFSLLHMLI